MYRCIIHLFPIRLPARELVALHDLTESKAQHVEKIGLRHQSQVVTTRANWRISVQPDAIQCTPIAT